MLWAPRGSGLQGMSAEDEKECPGTRDPASCLHTLGNSHSRRKRALSRRAVSTCKGAPALVTGETHIRSTVRRCVTLTGTARMARTHGDNAGEEAEELQSPRCWWDVCTRPGLFSSGWMVSVCRGRVPTGGERQGHTEARTHTKARSCTGHNSQKSKQL